MKKRVSLFLVGGLFLLSCGNSSKRSPEYMPINDETTSEVDFEDDDDNSEIPDIRLTGRIETCNKCMGYGSVQDGLYGKPEICKFCWVSTNMRVQQGWTGFDGRFGEVDAVFNTLPADYFDELDWNGEGGYDDNGDEHRTEQIEAQIAWHEENIAQLEHELEQIEGSISRTQIQQQIIEEKYEIKRLKAILNNM